MDIKVLDNRHLSFDSVAVNDMGVSGAAAGLGQAVQGIGNTLTKVGFQAGEAETLELAKDHANNQAYRNENGELIQPAMPEANGMLGPTLYDQAYLKQALDNYATVAAQNGTEKFREIHNQNLYNPDGFDVQAASYIESVSKDVPEQWKFKINETLDNIRIQHSNKIRTDVAQRDFRTNIDNWTNRNERLINEYAAILTKKDRNSDAAKIKEKEYLEHQKVAQENFYLSENDHIMALEAHEETVIQAQFMRQLDAAGGDIDNKDERAAVIEAVRNGDIKVQDAEGNWVSAKKLVSLDKLGGMANNLQRYENAHYRTKELAIKAQTDDIVEDLKLAYANHMFSMLNKPDGEEIDPTAFNAEIEAIAIRINQLQSDDIKERDRARQEIVTFALEAGKNAVNSSHRYNSATAARAAEKDNTTLFARRITRNMQDYPGIFKEALGIAYEDWTNAYNAAGPELQWEMTNDAHQQIEWWIRTQSRAGQYDELYSKFFGWFDKAAGEIEEYNKAHDLPPGSRTTGGLRYAAQRYVTPVLPVTKKTTEFMDHIIQADAARFTGSEIDWSDTNTDPDTARFLVDRMAIFSIPPESMMDYMKSAARQIEENPQAISKALSYFEMIKQHPGMYMNMSKDALLGSDLFRAYSYLSNAGGDARDLRTLEGFKSRMTGEGIVEWDDLPSEKQKELNDVLNETMSDLTEIEGAPMPPQLKPLIRQEAINQYVIYSDDADVAVETAMENVMQQGGWAATYSGFDYTVGSRRGQREENIRVYSRKPPEYFASNGVLDKWYVYGDTGDQIMQSLDWAPSTQLYKDANEHATNVLRDPPPEGWQLGKNFYLQFVKMDPSNYPEYRIIIESPDGRFYPAVAKDQYYTSPGARIEPNFNLGEWYPKWKNNELKRYQDKADFEKKSMQFVPRFGDL